MKWSKSAGTAAPIAQMSDFLERKSKVYGRDLSKTPIKSLEKMLTRDDRIRLILLSEGKAVNEEGSPVFLTTDNVIDLIECITAQKLTLEIGDPQRKSLEDLQALLRSSLDERMGISHG